MDIAIKLTLVSAIVMMGYNISEFVTSFKTLCDKVDEIKSVAAETKASDMELRRSNFILSFILSVVFAALVYFSGFAYWLLAIVVGKLLLTLYLSDSTLVAALHSDVVPKKIYKITKMDALANALVGLAVAIISVF